MVGFEPKHKVQLTHTEYVIAGAVSGAATRATCHPLDVLKIRFQLQIEPLKKQHVGAKYHGIVQAAQTILREEGLTAFWKGHISAQYLSVTFGVVQFGVFEILTRHVWTYLPAKLTSDLRPLTHTLCGAVAGCSAMAVVQPFDVLRTRFIAQGAQKEYMSIRHAVRSIHKHEGIRGFYRGLVPAMFAISPQIGLQFGLYSLFVQMWDKVFNVLGTRPPGIVESFLCGTCSGLGSKLVIYPMDVVKKRLQVQGFERARQSFGKVAKYTGLVNCLVEVVRQETVLGLYKGLSPSLLKAAMVTGVHFCTYDQICYWLSLRH